MKDLEVREEKRAPLNQCSSILRRGAAGREMENKGDLEGEREENGMGTEKKRGMGSDGMEV